MQGWLTDFFDTEALVEKVARLADAPETRRLLGENARAHVIANYDLRTHCLPRLVSWVEDLAARPARPPMD